MATGPNTERRPSWTPEEAAREEAATRARSAHDRTKTPQQRLEETLRLSRLMSELRQGMPSDVRAG
ncbi:MAG TPA: hypothetical protein VMD79_07670 [Solirubrobacteraceae bacterium]|nr:hypothetical protein [Solirubrobacteraceae bacterium]